MRTYDILLMWFILWIVAISVYLFIPLILLPELNKTNVYQVIGLIIVVFGLCMILLYFFALKRQQKQIQVSLKTLQDSGIQVFVRKYEKLLYSRDIGDIPKIIRILFNFNCIAIIQPKTIVELQSVINLCEKFRIPLIARGAGTSGYGGTLPIKNGIILSLTYLDKVIALDEKNFTVEVESGITWEHLRQFLEPKGLTLQSYPSSAPSSTIGGWVTQGGYGVGSTKFGSINQSVIKITILGTEGKEFHIEKPDFFIGSCGKLGVLWKITLKIKELANLTHIAVSSPHQDQLLRAVSAYQSLLPFFLRYDDYQNLSWKNSSNQPRDWLTQECTGGVISMSFQKENWNKSDFDKITNDYQLSEMSHGLGEKFWEERFNTMKLKRKGPSLIAAEVLIPTINLDRAIGELNNRFDSKIFGIELVATSDKVSILFVWFPVDIRRKSLPFFGSFSYFFHWFRTFDIVKIARRWKGRPYTSGLWFSPYSSLIFNERLDQMKQMENITDPYQIFNPGKVWGTRIPRFFPFIPFKLIFYIYMPFMGLLYRILPKKLR